MILLLIGLAGFWTETGDFPQYHLPALLFVIALAVLRILWLVPKRQAARSEGVTSANRFDRENEARKTLAQIIGGIFVLASLYSSIKAFDLQRQTESLQEQAEVTERFTKAIEQLGALTPGGALDADGKPRINLVVRLGGIYALERIAQDSPRDHWTIMEVLAAYVRENAPIGGHTPMHVYPQASVYMPRADVQAALTVIGRRKIANDPRTRLLLLSETDLRGADLDSAHLERANLYGARMQGAMLTGAYLSGATLNEANLNGADLQEAHLSSAYMGIYPSGYYTGEAQLGGADLSGASLADADLQGVDLSGVKGLTPQALADTEGNGKTILPKGLHPPPRWAH